MDMCFLKFLVLERLGVHNMRIATFNCENLFARYKFKKNIDPVKEDGFTIDDMAFNLMDEDEKRITGEAIKEVNADVIALQEIESLPILDRFTTEYLDEMGYKYGILIDSHDPRQIDVAILSKYPVNSIKTHKHELSTLKRVKWLFSRDCLETEIDVDGKTLHLYTNHLKSMMEGREKTKPRRVEQSKRVAEIIYKKWKENGYKGNFVVLGDHNDYPEGNTSLTALLEHPGLENVVERLPAEDQWTHFYAPNKEYRQLDYLFLSKSLAELNTNKPEMMRKGIYYGAEKYSGPRFDKIGKDKPKASDHVPLYMDINLE